jgi:hypothetical protein
MDELKRSPRELLARTQRFLGLPELDLVGDAVHSENETKSELKVHARRRLVAQVKRLPGVAALTERIDPAWRRRAVELLLESPWGAHVGRGFEPPPMRDGTRERLVERFTPSIRRLEALMDQDLSEYCA